jgi:hypothetical protein
LARILGRYEPEERPGPLPAISMGGATGADAWRLADGEPMSFAPKETTISLRRRGYAAATIELAEELADAFGYVVGALALVGLWRLRRRLVRPVDRFTQIYALLFVLAVLHFAAGEGYVSARHLLTLVVMGVGCAGCGAFALGEWIARRKHRPKNQFPSSVAGTRRVPSAGYGTRRVPTTPDMRKSLLGRPKGAGPGNEARSALEGNAAGGRTAAPSSGRRRAWVTPSRIGWATVLVVAAICVVDAVKPLHASRLGHRLAAEWLARGAAAPGWVLDTRGWTGLYSGRMTCRYEDGRAVFCHPQLAYVVLERRELEYESRRSRTLRRLVESAGVPVAGFPAAGDDLGRDRSVRVYRWEPARFRRWLASRSQGCSTGENRDARLRAHVPQKRL